MTGDPIPLDLHVGNPACVDMAEEVGVSDVRLRALSGGSLEQIEQRDQQEADDDPERQVLAEIVQPSLLCRRLDATRGMRRAGDVSARASKVKIMTAIADRTSVE